MQWRKYCLLILTLGLVLLTTNAITACSQPAQIPPPVVSPPTKPAQTTDNKLPEQVLSPTPSSDEDNWNKVETFTGEENQITPTFHISSSEWRIYWVTDAQYPEYAVFGFFIYPAGKDSNFVEKVLPSESSGDTIYIYDGEQDYYIKVIAANLHGWTIIVEEPSIKTGKSLSPVQIIHIHYKGKIYPPEPEKQLCYERIEPDEYVEIKNLSNAPQDIRGWVLRNENKSFPIFTFPPFLVSPYLPVKQSSFSSPVKYATPPAEASEYPKPLILEPYQAVRVYTDEFHTESGGFSFYYGAGDVWDNDKPDVAVLYNANQQEVSRRSYRIIKQDNTSE